MDFACIQAHVQGLNYEPLPSATANSEPSKNFLTFGGHGVDSGTIPTASYIVENFKKTNTGNVDFDMEGGWKSSLMLP